MASTLGAIEQMLTTRDEAADRRFEQVERDVDALNAAQAASERAQKQMADRVAALEASLEVAEQAAAPRIQVELDLFDRDVDPTILLV
eukprot:10225151-Lingulodinium_polyedra.AAC.1